jgi:enamine deaminase RidA (YjgF/YER057c/UK114 family)
MGGIEQRLAELGLVLPEIAAARGNYVQAKAAGDLLFLSGKGPRNADGSVVRGRLGAEIGVAQGYQLARQTGLILIAVMRDHLGTLDRVASIVKLVGLVNATPEFDEHPKVIDGCSDLMVEVFGERGRHARTALGAGSLPSGMPVEIELILAIQPLAE